MLAMRTFGLIFFTTLLVGGCILAATSQTPGSDTLAQSSQDISWDQAVDLLGNGQVAFAAQTHSLQVYLELADGSRLRTLEPQIDAIFAAVEGCGAPCLGIQLATE
jgi:hypothetical protein